MSANNVEEGMAWFTGVVPVDDHQVLDMARNALRNGVSADTLISEWFDDSGKFKRKYSSTPPRSGPWDESAFAAGRDGESNNAGISFNVEGPEMAVIQGVTPPPDNNWPPSGAPSRPPSRANNVSPLGRVVDWTASAASGPLNEEDAQLERALRESAADAGVKPHEIYREGNNVMTPQGAMNGDSSGSGMPPQESGITNGNSNAPVNFGPANRDAYDDAEWGMVTRVAAVAEPVPSTRKRETGAPAFLVQAPNRGDPPVRLGAILTIYHEIPLTRNVLLQTGTPSSSYGHNPEWWKGERIYQPHTLARLQEDSSESSGQDTPAWQEEVHRLMAFLDSTERSYGSISPLAKSISPGAESEADTRFFDALLSDTDPAILEPLLHEASSLKTKSLEVSETADRFAYLEFELTKNQWTGTKTFYDVWDWLAWEMALNWQEVNDKTRMTVMGKMGEVLTIKIDGDNPDDNPPLEIPEVWYPERYLESRKEEGKQIQEQLAWVASALYNSMDLERKHGIWKDPKTDKVWTRDEIAHEIETWASVEKWYDFKESYKPQQGLPQELLERIAKMNLSPSFTEEDAEAHGKVKLYLSRLRAVLAELDGKLANLHAETAKIRSYKEYLQALLTDPEKAGPAGPFRGKKFLLRGVVTAANVIYVCKRSEPKLIEFEDSAREPVDQWWRLAYVPDESEAVSAKKVSFELVQRQMFQESRNPSLVYATEAALQGVVPVPLADPLQRFVKADNKTFRAELAREKAEGESQADVLAATDGTHVVPMTPMSPTKRKYRSNSNESMASDRASIGGNSAPDSRMGDFTDFMGDFGGQEGPLGREMATEVEMADMEEATKPGGDLRPLSDANRASTFPKSGAHDVEMEPPQRSSTTEVLLQAPVEMRERRGNSPFLGPRSGSTSSDTRQVQPNLLDLDSSMGGQEETKKN